MNERTMLSNNVEFIDGNGNCYKMQKTTKYTIEYIPVKPINSSSGIYDGGEYINKQIPHNQFLNLLTLIQKIIGKEENIIDKRIKGSGMIIKRREGGREIFLIDPKSNDLKRLLDALNGICFKNGAYSNW